MWNIPIVVQNFRAILATRCRCGETIQSPNRSIITVFTVFYLHYHCLLVTTRYKFRSYNKDNCISSYFLLKEFTETWIWFLNLLKTFHSSQYGHNLFLHEWAGSRGPLALICSYPVCSAFKIKAFGVFIDLTMHEQQVSLCAVGC